jgi:hypothetical protein
MPVNNPPEAAPVPAATPGSERSVPAFDIRDRSVFDRNDGKKSGRWFDRQISSREINVLNYVLTELQIRMRRVDPGVDVCDAYVLSGNRESTVASRHSESRISFSIPVIVRPSKSRSLNRRFAYSDLMFGLVLRELSWTTIDGRQYDRELIQVSPAGDAQRSEHIEVRGRRLLIECDHDRCQPEGQGIDLVVEQRIDGNRGVYSDRQYYRCNNRE